MSPDEWKLRMPCGARSRPDARHCALRPYHDLERLSHRAPTPARRPDELPMASHLRAVDGYLE